MSVKSSIFFVLSICGVAVTGAQTIHVVTNSTDDHVNSLRNVINVAQDGDTIYFGSNLKNDTLFLDSSKILITKDLTIVGFPENFLCIRTLDSMAIFEISQKSNTTFCYINLIGGYGEYGGGIVNRGRCNFIRSRLAHSYASYGGGFLNDSTGSLLISESTIENNSAEFNGGGILNLGDCEIRMSTVNNNSTNYIHGGGISNVTGKLVCISTTISSNNCRKFGGGIYNSSHLEIYHCTIVLNEAERGGGIFNVFQQGFITGSHSLIALNNVIIAGPDIHDPNGQDVISLGYNMISNISYLANAVGSIGDIFGFPDDPIDPMIGPLQDNGGYTKTHQLLCYSPAVNKGDTISEILSDQRGSSRNYDFRLDIGAFELQKEDCELIGITQNIDIFDIDIYPNPVRGMLNIEIEASNPVAEVALFNIHGQKVLSDIHPIEGSYSISELSSGIYLLQIRSTYSLLTKKLIINNK